ncbi:Dihydroorotate dehydrogenase B (NAD(+)), electron transfer subunit [uncultured Paludibacter sp.]|nr:Dihydroorotate dehydrogenase B (NAD(+)), electron transfer subunit [uncultured Paludibacter sp.]
MRKYIKDLIIKENKQLNYQYFLLKLTSNEKLPEIEPGQFAQIKVEGSPTTFLRRPISINFVDYDSNELWLLIQVVGDGTRTLSNLKAGDTLNLIFPLGNTFTLPKDKDANVLLIGGGVGIAPLLMYGEKLYRLGYKCNFLLGARSKTDLLQLDDFLRYGTVFTTTEDGSYGEKGFVTHHSLLNASNFDYIYTCGPTPMMKAVSRYAQEKGIFCEVSLENVMGCGIGACLCCVTATTEGNVCVCTEGPIFNITKLKWQI